MSKNYKYWESEAEKDLKSAMNILNSGEFHWSLFIGHLALEKLLKSLYTKRQDDTPPFIHNLVRLADLCEIDLNNEQRLALLEINTFNLNARYDEYKNEFYHRANKEYAEKWIKIIEELFQWIKKST